ncbi:hypothetical protein BC835DRAFT_451765 [Cytidiella melzeri]|nr:hypothetical protein BC835DRAFT_451765 [Cytidiella melzeri]
MTMPSATFEYLPGKLTDAFDYVRDCFEWLAAGGGNLESLSHELNLERIAREAEHLLLNIRYVQNRLAPVNRLPSELLGVIFEQMMDSHLPAKAISYRKIGCQWPVAQSVCRHWRSTAVHTPMLWTYIEVHDSHSTMWDSRRGVTSTIFARSGVLPLNLHLIANDSQYHRGGKSLLDELASNSWRYQNIFNWRR